jgi:F0F1-type ATP synthase alpha subunit
VPRFHEELREHLHTDQAILQEIREKKELSDELLEKLNAELKKFAESFYVEEKAAV